MLQLNTPSHLAVALLLAAAAVAAAVSGPPSPQTGAACQYDIGTLQSTCNQSVQKDGPKVQPSPDCCATMKALADANLPCICDYLSSPAAREKISLEKVFYVTKECGITIPRSCSGSKQI